MSKKINILIVDDRRENLLALEAVLKSPDYHLILASSGEETLKCLLKDDFAVILLDVQMPGMDGFETARLIRARKRTRDTPIIFITAIYQTTDNIVQGYSLGAIDYLFKPFHPEALKLKIEAFVKIYLHREQIRLQNELLTQRAVELEKLNESLWCITSDLRKAEALARVIGETSTDTVITLDGTGRILTVNPAVMEMFGYVNGELQGQHVSKLFPGESLPFLNNARVTSKKNKILEATATRKDGTVFPVEVQSGGASIEEQQIFVWSVRNITERKQLEKEREDRYKTLERLVQERTRELSLTNEKLRREILERNKIAEQLRESSLKLNNILQSITDVFFSLNHQWQFIFVNEEAEKFWLKSRNELIGRNIWELFPEAFQKYHPLYQKAMNTKEVAHSETRGLHSDAWYEMYVYPSNDGLSVYYRDISERRQAEEALIRTLAESQQREAEITALFNSTRAVLRFKGFKDAAKDIFYSCMNLIGATSGYIILVDNDCQGYEIPFIELGGQNCTAALSLPTPIHGIQAEAYRTRKTVYHNDFANSDWQSFIPEGHIRIDSILYAPFLIDNKVIGLLSLGNKQGGFTENDARIVSVFCEIVAVAFHNSWTMESLKNSEEKFSKVFKNSPILMSIKKLDGRYVDVNNSFTSKTGYTCEEVMGGTDEEINIQNPGESIRFLQTIIEQKSIQNLETKIITKSGNELIGLCSAEMINVKGYKYILSLINDITKLRQMEKDMFRLERLNLVGEMAASIGHEIRNPMTTVRGFLQMLGDKEECAKFKGYYELMIEELDRANSIITEYLSLAKNKSIELQEQNLTSIVRALFPLIQADAMHSDKYIVVELEDSLPLLLLDQKEIRQLILNLVRNGLEAMSPGGNLTIRTFLDGEEVVLSVKDQGRGIEPNVLEKIGTPFFTTKDNGTGLGLALCYSIASRHNANIRVETGLTGTNFLVRFNRA